LGTDYNSKGLFGSYIHKYYYNASIADGYTLRLIREEIETSYKLQLQKTLDEIKVLRGEADTKMVYSHHKFVEPMLDYIVKDFEQARISFNDNTIGGMVVCHSSDQAKLMYEIFQEKYGLSAEQRTEENLPIAADLPISYGDKMKSKSRPRTAALILHDSGTKQDRDDEVNAFKAGKIDLLFVYNMLLTGFDAKRLKKLYLGRVIKAHNLLQTLTRVNRTYKDYRYGFVVDFADIQREFDKTNKAYFDELQSELGDEMEHYSNIFKSAEEIDQEIQNIKDVLFRYDTTNAENFSRQISEIKDRKLMVEITKTLNDAKSLYNLIRLSGHYEMLDRLDFHKITLLAREANNRLALINDKEALENNVDNTNILNMALEDVLFTFVKVREEEMILADQLKNVLQRTRESLGGNFDPRDPEFIYLREELERLFKNKKLNEVTKEDMESNIDALNTILERSRDLERRNQLLKAKYENDEKYARLHKRLMEKDPLTPSESKLLDALIGLKHEVDEQLMQNNNLLENETYVERMVTRLVLEQMKKQTITMNPESVNRVRGFLVKEYMNEYHGIVA
jgi:type I restriction enzyme R subunit